jgi:hypothetical protein
VLVYGANAVDFTSVEPTSSSSGQTTIGRGWDQAKKWISGFEGMVDNAAKRKKRELDASTKISRRGRICTPSTSFVPAAVKNEKKQVSATLVTSIKNETKKRSRSTPTAASKANKKPTTAVKKPPKTVDLPCAREKKDTLKRAQARDTYKGLRIERLNVLHTKKEKEQNVRFEVLKGEYDLLQKSTEEKLQASERTLRDVEKKLQSAEKKERAAQAKLLVLEKPNRRTTRASAAADSDEGPVTPHKTDAAPHPSSAPPPSSAPVHNPDTSHGQLLPSHGTEHTHPLSTFSTPPIHNGHSYHIPPHPFPGFGPTAPTYYPPPSHPQAFTSYGHFPTHFSPHFTSGPNPWGVAGMPPQQF